ncbi:GyrI-like domain-containing protein [Glutamicibacter sp.]|uniref:GyrI-like domain-containing protein n=1 Tax=Glutamicibacter sp. TaxID=1931995 RepID=UPI0028BD9576|nr:GyrI-like domain-containing protein [Glutamicibacter sp.]
MAQVVLMPKFDFKKTPPYRASTKFEIVDMPAAKYLMIDGHGDPNTDPIYERALQTLYPVAYKIKFASKESGRDYVVPPLEGLWWAEDMDSFTRSRDKSKWLWTMLLAVPEWITEVDVAQAVELANRSGKFSEPQLLRLDSLDEGLCVQVLHHGSYDDEASVLAQMHQYIDEQGLQLSSKHHEIYLSDPRRVQPENLRTILRQPVTQKSN